MSEELQSPIVFSYQDLPENIAQNLKLRKYRINEVYSRSLFQMIEELAEAQKELINYHDQYFGEWAKIELNINDQTADNLVNIYHQLDKIDRNVFKTLENSITDSVLYSLTELAIVNELTEMILKKAKNREEITDKELEKIKLKLRGNEKQKDEKRNYVIEVANKLMASEDPIERQGGETLKVMASQPSKVYGAFTQAKTLDPDSPENRRVKKRRSPSSRNSIPIPKVELGQVWQLNEHRIYCIDSCDWKPPKAKMAFADPPYGFGVDNWDKELLWQHDWLQDVADYVLVTVGTRNLKIFQPAMKFRWLLTYHMSNGMTHGPIGYANAIHVELYSKLDSVKLGISDVCRDSIIKEDSLEHKGQKPIGLLRWLIKSFTKVNDLILDPFLGTGTTLLAADELVRACHGCEIDPEYCQEIIDRWQHRTKSKANLLERD
jgi:hypothetical protein